MTWQPVEDGEYGTHDTLIVKKNGGFVAINSNYGNGGSRLTAMMPLPQDIRLCRQVPDQTASVLATSERVAALRYAIERADFSELRGHEVLAVLDAMLQEMKGEASHD